VLGTTDTSNVMTTTPLTEPMKQKEVITAYSKIPGPSLKPEVVAAGGLAALSAVIGAIGAGVLMAGKSPGPGFPLMRSEDGSLTEVGDYAPPSTVVGVVYPKEYLNTMKNNSKNVNLFMNNFGLKRLHPVDRTVIRNALYNGNIQSIDASQAGYKITANDGNDINFYAISK